MSITFTPTAGTWTSYHYYESEVDELTGLPIPSGVVAFPTQEPEVQCHNSGGLMLIERLGLAPANSEAGECYGSVHGGHILAIWSALERACEVEREKINEGKQPNSYTYRKLAEFRELLLHCRYHQCGFTWD